MKHVQRRAPMRRGPGTGHTIERSDAAGALDTSKRGRARRRDAPFSRPDSMLIRLHNTALVDDLCVHFLRSGFTVERAGGGMVEVERPDAPSPQQARREVLMHLRIWDVLNPDARCELL